MNPFDVLWKQGKFYEYMNHWQDYWTLLPKKKKQDYLKKTKAPISWKNYLNFIAEAERLDKKS